MPELDERIDYLQQSKKARADEKPNGTE